MVLNMYENEFPNNVQQSTTAHQNIPTNNKNTMQKKRKKKKNSGKSFVRLVVCLIISIFSFLVLTATQSYILKNKITETIVIASKDLTINTEITKDNIQTYFKEIERDSTQVSSNNYKSLDDIPEGILNDNILKGEEILKKDIIDKQTCLEYLDNDEVVEMSLKLSDIGNIVGGTIRPGDLVNISCINNVLDEAELLFSKVYVKNVFDSAGGEVKRGDDVSAMTLIILVSPEMEEYIYSKMCNGDLKISRYSLSYN